MKVLHINSYYSTSLFYKNLFDYQVKNGLDIDVFVPTSTSFRNHKFDYGNYTTISKTYNQYDRVVFHLKHSKILSDIQVKYNIMDYSLIHAHSLFSNGYIALKLKKKYDTPYIVAVRNTDVNTFFKKMPHLRKMGVEIIRNASSVIFLSKSYRDEVIEKYIPRKLKKSVIDKTQIIPNGIDDFWLKNIGAVKKRYDNLKLRLLQVGDIDKNKNIQTTVKAIDFLAQKGFTVEFNIVGRIKNKKVFSDIVNLEHVNYLGFMEKEQLIEVYRKNDIFILPSIKETFGLVYAEAMSQGLPIIYSKGQGFDKQFPDGEVGFSVDCYDSGDIAARAIQILDRYERISQKCISNCSKYNWSIPGKDYASVYYSISME